MSSDYGYRGVNHLSRAPWFDDWLREQGGVTDIREREVPGVASWGGPLRELSYQNAGEQRYAYALTHWGGGDDPHEEVYVFSEPVPDAEIADLIERIRRQR